MAIEKINRKVELNMKKIIIVMPVANEEEHMEEVLKEILTLPYNDLSIYLIIDNFSTDRTEEIIRKYEKQTNRVRCIFYLESRGVISCYLEGFRQALRDGAEYIIEMDGGGSHLPKEIPQFIENLDRGYDCVWGSRFITGGKISHHALYRRMLSSGGTMLSNLVLGTKLRDMTSGFEGFTRNVLENLNFDAFLSTGHMYQTEMRFYCRNLHTIEVPIHYIGGSSSLKLKSVWEAIKILFMLRKNEPRVWKQKPY